MNNDQIVSWACLLEFDTNNLNCANKDGGKPQWGKFFFMHTFSIVWNMQSSALTSNGENIIQLGRKPSYVTPPIESSSTNFAPIVVIVVSGSALFIIGLFVAARCYRRPINLLNHEARSLPVNINAENEYIETFDLRNEPSEDHLDLMCENNSIISSNECEDCQMITSLPSAILKLPDMLYPRCSVTIEEGLGFGNFGTVFKGSLRIANAR